MDQIKVGDSVLVPSGGIAKVSGVFPQGLRPVWRITLSDGTRVEADSEHIWEVIPTRSNLPELITTKELAKLPDWKFCRTGLPKIKSVAFQWKPCLLHPYLVGALIGDGGLTGATVRFSSVDSEILEMIGSILPEGFSLKPQGGCDWNITTNNKSRNNKPHLIDKLRTLGLWGKGSSEKYIPQVYLYNTEEVRLQILQGILDTDGSVNKHGQAILEQTSKRLAFNVTTLVQSLGGSVLTTYKGVSGYLDEDGCFVQCKPVYRQVIEFDFPEQLFTLSRKINLTRHPVKPHRRMFEKIEYLGMKDCQCIQVDHPKHLYLTNGFVPTHNTVACIVWLTEKALQGKKGQNFWWIAPSYNQAKIAFTRVGNCLTAGTFTENKTDMVITLPNGAVMQFKTGEMPDKLYGEDVWAAVVDEASRVREEAWVALRSTITATGGPVRAIGNVRGRKNWFFQMARIAEKGDNPHMRYAKLTVIDAIAAGVFSEDEAKDAAGMMSESAYKELYMAEPSDDGGNPFGGDLAIQACEIPEVLWENKPICWGWDLAKSVDWTVGIGLDSEGNVCRFYRWQKPWQETIAAISSFVGDVPTLIDATGVGDPVLEALQRQGNRKAIHGFKFSSSSKQQLMEGLAVAIQSQEVHFQHNPVGIELGLFEYQYTRTGVRYSAPDMTGVHDDCVCSLALAWKQYKKPPLPEWVQQTLSWRPKQLVNIYAR